MITRSEILMDRDKLAPLDQTLELNLKWLLACLNDLRAIYGKPMIVTSGYRPHAINVAARGAKNSLHMTCQACDFRDDDGSLDEWCMAHLKTLEMCGLYLEHPDSTPGWCHLQCKPPASGHRVFRP